jgi:hypothetical protein
VSQQNQTSEATRCQAKKASQSATTPFNRLDYFTLSTIRELQDELKGIKSMVEWKKRVAAFRDEHVLDDLQAIAVATCKLPVWS